MADPTRAKEELPRTERQGMPGKTPGQAEGEDAKERREPPVHEPGKTAGTAEGGPEVSTDEVPAERSPDPTRV